MKKLREIKTIIQRAACSLVVFISFFLTLGAQVNTDNVLLMGRAALSLDDNLTAIKYFSQVIEAKPFVAQAWYFRAYAKLMLDDTHGAETDCDEAIRLNPYVVEVYQLRGLCRIRNKRYSEAVQDYDRVIQEMPADEAALFNRALCFLELKDYDAASKGIDDVLRRWHTYRKAYLVKSQIAMEQGDTMRAVHWMDSLLVINDREPQAWSFKGYVALQYEDFARADSFFTEAIRYQMNNFEHYLGRAQARNGLSRFGDAIKDYTKVIDYVPEHFVAHYNRGLLRALVGDDNNAIKDFDFVLKKEPDNTLAMYNRAQLREQTGDLRGAAEDYSKLLKTYPNFIQGYVARARIRRQMGNIRGAQNDEAVVQRYNLDIAFANNRRRPVTKVRKRSDHALENYQQLVEEETDTTWFFKNELFGKIQNLPSEDKLLPQFALSFQFPQREKGYHSLGYLSETALLQKESKVGRRLYFSAETGTGLSESEVSAQLSDSIPTRNSLLLRAIVCRDSYDLVEALKLAEQALQKDSTFYLTYLLRVTVLCELQITSSTEHGDKDALRSVYLSLAKNDMERAITLQPSNAYVHYNRGCLLAQSGNEEEAMQSFRKAIELDDRLAEAYYNLALLQVNKSETNQAIANLSRAGGLGLYKAYNQIKKINQSNSK